jgi:hypothetical protein
VTYQHIGNGPAMQAAPVQLPAPRRRGGAGKALLFATAGLVIGLGIGCAGGFAIGAADVTDKPTAAAATTAPGQQPPKDAGPPTLAAGAAANITTTSGDQLTVTVAEPKTQTSSGNQFMTPKKGHFFVVVVTVDFKKGDSTYFANPTDLKLIAADGTAHGAEILSVIEPAFESLQLNAGQKTTGKVVFDVPKSVTPGSGAKIQFEGSWDGQAAAFWTV